MIKKRADKIAGSLFADLSEYAATCLARALASTAEFDTDMYLRYGMTQLENIANFNICWHVLDYLARHFTSADIQARHESLLGRSKVIALNDCYRKKYTIILAVNIAISARIGASRLFIFGERELRQTQQRLQNIARVQSEIESLSRVRNGLKEIAADIERRNEFFSKHAVKGKGK